MHHLIGLGSCLCLSLHHSISSVITHMPRRGRRPDNGRLKGPWARQRGAAVCRRGNTASSPNYPSTALGKTQWGRSLATLYPPPPTPTLSQEKKKKVMSWGNARLGWEMQIGGCSNWMWFIWLMGKSVGLCVNKPQTYFCFSLKEDTSVQIQYTSVLIQNSSSV